MADAFDATPLIRKLESIFALTDKERAALQNVPGTVRTFNARQDILREDDRPTACCLVLDGFAYSYKRSLSGKQQVVALHIPGDFPDLQSLQLNTMDFCLGTLTPSTLAFLSHATVRDLIRRCPRIGDALWRETLMNGAAFREWMLSLGRRSAYSRFAHLLCELYVRLQAVGLTQGECYHLPLTQAELGNVLGLTNVHVNRTLQQLRADGLITLQAGSVAVLDWDRLSKAGEFEPTYLHLQQQAA